MTQYTKPRYYFWRVFWVTLAIYLFFMMIGIIATMVSPVTEKDYDWHKMFTWKHLLSQVLSLIVSVLFFYYTLNTNYRLFANKRPYIDYARPTVIAIASLAAYLFLSYQLLPSEPKMKEKFPLGIMIFSFSLSVLFQTGLSILIAYLTYLRDERKQRKILEEQKMQLEVEKSQANFNFLKAQINPHFLHNTLNFLYAKSLPYSPELSEGILTLSDIMRYALSEGNARDGKAPLKDEIEHVRNVIKINQLRFSNNLNVQFEVEGIVNGAMIIPFVLITLVENAFKHGDLKSSNNPILITLKIDRNSIYFSCQNKKKLGPKELSTGIGLDNIKKRLDLAYGREYKLVIKEDELIYRTELTINQL